MYLKFQKVNKKVIFYIYKVLPPSVFMPNSNLATFNGWEVEVGNTLKMHQELEKSIGGGDHLPLDGQGLVATYFY